MTTRKDNIKITALSTSLCSIASAIFINPLEVLKVRQQSQNIQRFLKLASTIFKKEGFMTFYNGFSYNLITNGVSNGFYFLIYDSFKPILLNNFPNFDRNHRVLFPFINSTISRFIASTLFFPFECLKTQKQSIPGFKWIHFNELLKQQGLKAYFLAIERDILLAQIYWVCAENMRTSLNKRKVNENLKNILVGGISGVFSSILTHPIDVIKTQKQTNINYNNLGFMRISKEIYKKNNGINGFFLGIYPRILKVSISGAIMISSYEYVYHKMLQFDKRKLIGKQ